MAANVFVVDSSFRRTQIKVSPNTYLRSVLEEACGKLKLDPDQYTLKYESSFSPLHLILYHFDLLSLLSVFRTLLLILPYSLRVSLFISRLASVYSQASQIRPYHALSLLSLPLSQPYPFIILHDHSQIQYTDPLQDR